MRRRNRKKMKNDEKKTKKNERNQKEQEKCEKRRNIWIKKLEKKNSPKHKVDGERENKSFKENPHRKRK